jgi:beta-glucosidase
MAAPPAFPSAFVWGAASASYQIEGAATADGKGPSIWDAFCKRPGAVWEGQTGDVACDHYHLWREDVALMKALGLRAYRFSISWPRVLPEGTGKVNAPGLDFYDRLVDALLEAGIAPYATLYHWDFPLALHDLGGWLHEGSPRWFAEYARVVSARLGDRVASFMTMNEPQVVVDAGLRDGRHAPGEKRPFAEVLRAVHHVLLAHGLGVQALRAECPRTPVGLAPVGLPAIPASTDTRDVDAARDWTFRTASRSVRTNAWWMDPIFLGEYPADGVALFAADMPPVAADDMRTIAQPLDYFGVNVYDAPVVRAGAAGPEAVPMPVGAPITAFDWRVTPEALYWGPRFFHERYRLPVLVTENGLSCRDWVSLDGAVHDPQRIDFIARHLRELRRAATDGTPILGYFHWTLLDNFEWAHGYKHRFGLVYVDFATQERIVKDSGRWYAQVVASNGALAL